MDYGEWNDTRSLERAARSIDLGSIPRNSAHRAHMFNPSIHQSIMSGTSETIPYNSTINAYDASIGEDAIQAMVTTALGGRFVPQAGYGAQLDLGCMEGTRVEILHSIKIWIMDPDAPQILWLTGHAGLGKSAIASTVCSRASEDPDIVLGGSFFCSRSAGSIAQRDVRCIVPTLAQLLALKSPEFGKALAGELARDPDVLNKQIAKQVELLLQKPLLALKDSSVQVLFVIDALDECGGPLNTNGTLDNLDGHRIVTAMLESLAAFSRSPVPLPVKFLVTSRPGTDDRGQPVSETAFCKVIQLHAVEPRQVTKDIRLSVSTQLSSTPTLRSWFTVEDADALARLCDGQFLVATTALQYTFGAGMYRAPQRYKTMLETFPDSTGTGTVEPLDHMYALVMDDAATSCEPEVDELPVMLNALVALLTARMTLSISALADLLEMTREDLRASLSRLYAVVHIPESDDDPSLRAFHSSFGDYLLERADDRYRINLSLGDATLASGCLQVMAKQLHFNVSQSRSSYELNMPGRPDSITLALEYACLHWVYHIAQLSAPPSVPDEKSSSRFRQRFLSFIPRTPRLPKSRLDEMVGEIFRPRLLFWLEVMSILGQIRRAAAILVFAAGTVQSIELSRFLRHANTFVTSSHDAIERSAPHIYLSALPFAARDSLVYQEFAPHCTDLITFDMCGIKHHAEQLVMRLTGHDSGVNSLAYSRDGRLMASGSDDGSIRVWDTRTGEEATSPLRSGDGSALSITFISTGEALASGTETGVVCIWRSLYNQVPPQRLTGHSGAVVSVAASPDGSRVASGSSDSTIRIWSTETGRYLAILQGHAKGVNAVSFSPDGEILVSGSQDATIRLWHGVTGEPGRHPPAYHYQPIRSVCFSPDGKRIAVTCKTDIILCRPQTGTKIETLHSGSSLIRSIGYSPDGQSIVFARDQNAYVLALTRSTDEASLMTLVGHTDKVRSVTFSPDGLSIASAADDRTIRILNSGRNESPSPPLAGHGGNIGSVAVAIDGARIVSGSEDRSVRVWDSRTGEPKLPPLLGHTGDVHSVVVSPDGRLIASASEDRTTRLWDSWTGRPVGRPMGGHNEAVFAVAFSPDARWVASGSADNTVRIWNAVTQQPSKIGPLSCYSSVYSVKYSSLGQTLAAGGGEGYICLWLAKTGQPACDPLRANSHALNSIGFSPNGTRIVSGGNENSVRVWDCGTGQQVLILDGHTRWVNSVAYSPGGRFIASGSSDATVRLWDAATGIQIASFEGHVRSVPSLAFTPSGRSIVSGSFDATIRVWDVGTAVRVSSKRGDDLVAVMDAATFNEGWLTGPSGELVAWVPAPYRPYLQIPPCRLLIDSSGIRILVTSWGSDRGQDWTLCWREDSQNTVTRNA